LQYCYNHSVPATFPAGQFSSSPITITVDGGNFDKGMKITGAGQNVTRIKKLGSSSSALITIQTAAPTTDQPKSIQLMLRDLTLDCTNETGPGLKLAAVAAFHIENVGITDASVGVELQSSLIGTIQKCKIVSNQVGVRSHRTGVAFCNHLTLRDNQITNNTSFGIDIDACDSLNLHGNQFEQNGVPQSVSAVTVTSASPAVVTWSGHGLVAGDPVVFTNSGGGLPAGITVNYIYYVLAAGLSTNTFRFSAQVGGAAVNTSSTGTGTHTASSPKTGAIVLRKACVDELGAAVLNITEGNRFEGNLGADIRTEFMTTAFGLYVNIHNSLMAGTSDGPMIAIGGSRKVSIEGCVAPVGSSTWNINTEQLYLKNSKVINLVRPGTETRTTVINSGFGGTDYPSGEKGSFTATLTGCTTSPTGTVTYTVQGDTVYLTLPVITGTSNSTAATLTGMPAVLWPTIGKAFVSKNVNNGVEILSENAVTTTGDIVLQNGLTSVFTSSGQKGHASGAAVVVYAR
jgi:hypothetical protein